MTVAVILTRQIISANFPATKSLRHCRKILTNRNISQYTEVYSITDEVFVKFLVKEVYINFDL